MTTKPKTAAARYSARVAKIKTTADRSTRAYADAMSAASLEYEREMLADIGETEAAALGAGYPTLATVTA